MELELSAHMRAPSSFASATVSVSLMIFHVEVMDTINAQMGHDRPVLNLAHIRAWTTSCTARK